jgi:hypothetical protein
LASFDSGIDVGIKLETKQHNNFFGWILSLLVFLGLLGLFGSCCPVSLPPEAQNICPRVQAHWWLKQRKDFETLTQKAFGDLVSNLSDVMFAVQVSIQCQWLEPICRGCWCICP